MNPEFKYKARVVSVYDGDSVTVDIDLGMYVSVRATLRLRGIDAPEMGTPEGLAARDWLRLLLLNSTEQLVVQTSRGDKYGRWLGELYLGDVFVNDALVQAGHARVYDGGAR